MITTPHPSAGGPTHQRFLSRAGALLTGLAFGAGLVVWFATPAGCAEQADPAGAAALSRSRIGRVVPPIDFRDTAGAVWSLTAADDARATVVAFLNFNCPVSNNSLPTLNALAKRFGTQGVTFVAVVCDAADAEEVDRFAAESKIACRVFFDPDKAVAAHFRATTTPQVFVIDRNRVLRYSGLVNNLYTSRLVRQPKADAEYLADAIAAVVAGQDVAIKETTPIGCPLELAARPVIKNGSVEFHRDIEPLLQQHCQRCHHPGDVAPFSLVTFDHAVQWAADIKSYTADRLMPPWPVTGGIPLENDLALEPEEIERIGRWVDEGCPRGDPVDAPPPLAFVDQDAWQAARPPDLVLKMPGTVHLAAQGDDHYRTIVLPLDNPEELYVERIEFIPGNRRAIHHGMVFYDGTGLVLAAQERLGNPLPNGAGDEDYGPGYNSGMGLGFVPDPTQRVRNPDNAGGQLMGWVPGVGGLDFPPGVRRVVPADAAIVMQIHYVRTGKPEIDDSSRIGIWLSKDPPRQFSHGFLLDTNFRLIPKGDANFKTTGSREITSDCQLWVMAPHMHRLGTEFRIWYQPPDSPDRELLLELTNWDFNWQHRYLPRDPFPMKKGARLHVEAVFDNSAGNPRRPPGPERTVFLGEGTADEMAFAVIGTIIDERPAGRVEMIRYFEKLIEAKAFQIGYEALGKE
jgi:peroxiredoxin